MSHNSKMLGIFGENLASDYLEKSGFKILERNYWCPLGEIDIVAKEHKTLVFVEVKTRKSDRHGSPLEAIGVQKQRQVLRAVKYYLKEKRFNYGPLRIDVVGVLTGGSSDDTQIKHIRNAFGE